MKKLWAVVAIICSLSLTLVGCGNTSKQEKVEEPKSDAVEIGMVFDTFVIERWERDRDVFVSIANELGATVDVQNPNGSVKSQIEAIQYFIDKKVDVIVIVPIDSEALAEVIQEAKDAGIKIMSYDRLCTDTNVDVYISFDNNRVGQCMGESIQKQMSPGDNVIMVCGPLTDSNVTMVAEGFEQVCDAHGLNVIDKVYMDEWKAELAYEYINSNIDKVRGCKAIMCGNDNLATQVVFALAENRLAGQIIVTGQDADLDACQRIAEGTQYMTVYKPINVLAEQAARTAVDLAKGNEIVYDDLLENGDYSIPFIKLSPETVTLENMDATIIDSGFHLKDEVYLGSTD